MLSDELKTLGEDIVKNGLTSPIVFWRANPEEQAQLLDGRNRLDAIESIMGPVRVLPPIIETRDGVVPAVKEWVTILDAKVDPVEYVIGANIHRRHLKPKKKRELLAELIKNYPQKSDRQLGEMAKTSKNTAAVVRQEMEGRGQIDHVETRTDTKGRKQPAKKKGRKKAADRPAHEPRTAAKSNITRYCSFCPKSEHEAEVLIVNPITTAWICNECVDLCVSIIAECKAAAANTASQAAAKAVELTDDPKKAGIPPILQVQNRKPQTEENQHATRTP